jgi:hypothetical protein
MECASPWRFGKQAGASHALRQLTELARTTIAESGTECAHSKTLARCPKTLRKFPTRKKNGVKVYFTPVQFLLTSVVTLTRRSRDGIRRGAAANESRQPLSVFD